MLVPSAERVNHDEGRAHRPAHDERAPPSSICAGLPWQIISPLQICGSMRGMLEKPELIARLQVGLAASGECSVCHEVFVVSQSSRPEQLSDRLKQIFEEHVRGVELSKKVIS